MSTDKSGSSKASDIDATNAESIQDLTDAQVADADAAKVKGGFNPQPDPPGDTLRSVDPYAVPSAYKKLNPQQHS